MIPSRNYHTRKNEKNHRRSSNDYIDICIKWMWIEKI